MSKATQEKLNEKTIQENTLSSRDYKYGFYTDIATDGALQGPNFKGIEEILNSVSIPVIASGGVSSLEDLKKLKALESKGLMGAITGKAIYEGKLDLTEAVKLCSQKG